MSIEAGCDAVQASAFFVFAVMASPLPVSYRARIPWLLGGTSLLLVINLVRIVSLFYTGVYFPKAFDLMHIDVWQAGFIFLPLCFWVLWARRVLRNSTG